MKNVGSTPMPNPCKSIRRSTGPLFVAIGPEHAQTLNRDGWTIASMQEALFERSRVAVERVSKENQESYEGQDVPLINGHYYLTPTPEDIHIIVAGGPGMD